MTAVISPDSDACGAVDPSESVRRTATRLLGSSSKNSYDPGLDIDWDAEPRDDLPFMPFERMSLYGTPLWETLTPEQRIELSRQELASIASTGLWFELILVQMLARWAYHEDPQDPRAQYALTEIGDETRHILMFSKAIARLGAPTYRPPAPLFHLARFYKATARGAALFAPVLVAEEVTDRLQRTMINDEGINPLIRMVNRIHVVEEARHVRFAREEVARLNALPHRRGRVMDNIVSAVVGLAVVSSLVNDGVYASVGLDPKVARRAARANPNYRETRRWLAEKIMGFLTEQGIVTWYTRGIYRRGFMI